MINKNSYRNYFQHSCYKVELKKAVGGYTIYSVFFSLEVDLNPYYAFD